MPVGLVINHCESKQTEYKFKQSELFCFASDWMKCGLQHLHGIQPATLPNCGVVSMTLTLPYSLRHWRVLLSPARVCLYCQKTVHSWSICQPNWVMHKNAQWWTPWFLRREMTEQWVTLLLHSCFQTFVYAGKVNWAPCFPSSGTICIRVKTIQYSCRNVPAF